MEKEEIALLRTVATTVQGKENTKQENEFELFGQYIAKNMKKLSARLDEHAMANVECKITTVLDRACRNQQPIP